MEQAATEAEGSPPDYKESLEKLKKKIFQIKSDKAPSTTDQNSQENFTSDEDRQEPQTFAEGWNT